MTRLRITTSWDDGHVLDWRVIDMLDRAGLKGTFYIARDFLDQRLSEADLRQIADRHEIGAHTLTHPTLTAIPLEQAEREIHDSKRWLEDVIGREVRAFCYPKGKHTRAHQQMVADAGYTLARGVDAYMTTLGDNPYRLPTTLHLYPFPLRPLPQQALWRGWRTRTKPLQNAIAPTLRHGVNPLRLRDWRGLARAWLDIATATGGIWHVWGHSWEIDRFDLWDVWAGVLDDLRAYEFSACTNSDLLAPDHQPTEHDQ